LFTKCSIHSGSSTTKDPLRLVFGIVDGEFTLGKGGGGGGGGGIDGVVLFCAESGSLIIPFASGEVRSTICWRELPPPTARARACITLGCAMTTCKASCSAM